MGPLLCLCYLSRLTQDLLQPPPGLPADPGCCLLAVPAASLSLQPLQLLGHPGVLQGGPAHPPGELDERVCGGVPCRGGWGAEDGEEWWAVQTGGATGKRTDLCDTPT